MLSDAQTSQDQTLAHSSQLWRPSLEMLSALPGKDRGVCGLPLLLLRACAASNSLAELTGKCYFHFLPFLYKSENFGFLSVSKNRCRLLKIGVA